VNAVLRGTVAQPGFPRRAVEIPMPASAISESEVVGEVPASALASLRASRGLFRGDLVLRFPSTAEGTLPDLVGRRGGLEVPVVAEVPPSADIRARLQDAAAAMLERLGLGVAEVPAAQPGGPSVVVVRSVRPGAAAPLDEIVPGDRLAALDGIPVSTTADLAPDPDAVRVTLSMREAATGRAFDVHPRLRDEVREPGPVEALAILIGLAVVGLVFLIHFAGFSDRLARLLAFPLVGRPRDASVPPPASGAPPSADRVGAVLLGLASAGAAAAPVVVHHALRSAPVSVLWAAVAAMILIHRVASAAGDAARPGSSAFRGLMGSFVATGAALAAVVPLTAAVLLSLWDSAALTVSGAVAAQGATPWDWALLRDPFALVVALLAAARLGAAFGPGQARWRTALDVSVAAVGAVLLAVVSLGGWNAGPAGDRVFAGLPVAAWVLEGKSAAAFAAIAWYGRRRAARGADLRRAGVAWIAAVPLALASIAVAAFVGPGWVSSVVRPVTVGAGATIALGMWVRYRQRSAPAILEIRVEPV